MTAWRALELAGVPRSFPRRLAIQEHQGHAGRRQGSRIVSVEHPFRPQPIFEGATPLKPPAFGEVVRRLGNPGLSLGLGVLGGGVLKGGHDKGLQSA
jgi:hypothetical protein